MQHKFFPAQEDSEKIFLLIRRHWFTYMIFWIVAFLLLIPLIGLIVYWYFNALDISLSLGNVFILGGSVYLLAILALLLYGFVDYYLDVYIVTDRRIVDIKQNGFFKREISELYLSEVQDVNAKVNGFFPTILHFGQVVIQTAGELENFVFNDVPHPYKISKKIIDLHEKCIHEDESGGDDKQSYSDDGQLISKKGKEGSEKKSPTTATLDERTDGKNTEKDIEPIANQMSTSSLLETQPVPIDEKVLVEGREEEI